MTPESFVPFSYLATVVQIVDERGRNVRAYVLAKKAAIFFKMSVSLFVVSSNPGVSMRTARLPSSTNSSASWTSSVQDSRSTPIRKFEWLTRLMN